MKKSIFNFEIGVIDAEGTILDNQKIYRCLLPIMFSIGFKGGNFCIPTASMVIPDWARCLQKVPGANKAALRIEQNILNTLNALEGKHPKTFKGARQVLYRLHRAGIKLYVSTGNHGLRITNQLQKEGLVNLFSLIVGSDKISKKNHVPFFADSLGLSVPDFAQKAFLFSDGPVDMILANTYGLHGIGITNTLSSKSLIKAGAKEVVSSWKELLS